MPRTIWRWLAGAVLLIAVGLFVATRFIDEPLRRRVEADMNAALKGYKVRLGQLHFHPIGFSVDLTDWVIVQEANPEPPVASIPKLHASLQWLELVRGHVVADFQFVRPRLYLDFRHVKKEAEDKTPIKERGWQDAAYAVYPFTINLLRIEDGDVTYVESGPLPPLHVSGLRFRAGNIRNIRSRDRTYPSDLRLAATIQDSAHLRVDGHADFLAVPYTGVKAAIDLDGLRLRDLEPILHHYDVDVRSGTLSAKGDIEYGPHENRVELANVGLERADVDYVKRRAEDTPVMKKAAQTAAKATQQSTVAIEAENVKVAQTRLVYRDEATSPPYALFVSDCDATVRSFSNVRSADSAAVGTFDVRGKFMDSGDTTVHATFRPRENRTDFDVALKIENADMRAMNDLWRAYGKFDVQRGRLSLYSEIDVANGAVDGYVKPMFADLDIGADTPKGVGQKAYEAVLGGVATVLRNEPKQDVATETSLSGPLENPHASLLDALSGVVQNAFFKAILPGLKRRRAGE